MLKFSCALIVAVFVAATVSSPVGNVTRIASGVPAVKGQNLDWVSLKVVFQNQMQMCAGKFGIFVKFVRFLLIFFKKII